MKRIIERKNSLLHCALCTGRRRGAGAVASGTTGGCSSLTDQFKNGEREERCLQLASRQFTCNCSSRSNRQIPPPLSSTAAGGSSGRCFSKAAFAGPVNSPPGRARCSNRAQCKMQNGLPLLTRSLPSSRTEMAMEMERASFRSH